MAGRQCGHGCPPLIVAELSGNHGGRLQTALDMIDAAAEAGADLVKIQTYRPDTITIDSGRPEFRIASGLWRDRTLYELYQEAHTPWEWHAALFERARERGVPLFSSPFDDTAVDLLESLDCPAYKVASFELVDIGLLERVAATGKPVILSTGMATLGEIDAAVDTLRRGTYAPLVLLHCTSAYPAPVDQANLGAMARLRARYGCAVGLSDHTTGLAVPVAAVALGACMIEKHFVLDASDGSVDAAFSLTPPVFRDLVDACRSASLALGDGGDGPTAAERSHLSHRRSLYVVVDVPRGTRIGREHIRSIRPGNGLPPRVLPDLLGQVAVVDIEKGTPASRDLFRPWGADGTSSGEGDD
ncbi:MAG: pseudaminic acid synthase [Gammaproteobacteria bacterium]|nr:pseudaminic acid synthase [Gammaproteobacteria bacterium]